MPETTSEEKLRKRLTTRFWKAVATYHLIDEGDKILVGLSGGKDSLFLLEMLASRMNVAPKHYSVAALHVRMENISYKSDTSYLQDFCKSRGVELHLRTTSFDASTDTRRSPCFLCSWYRRKELFNLAQELGCNKIALGHHQDDIIHTALMNTFFVGNFSTMTARLQMRKMPLTVIRPLCMETEEDIKEYALLKGFQKQEKLCPFEHDSHRDAMRRLFQQIEKISPEARQSIWKALNNAGKMEEISKGT